MIANAHNREIVRGWNIPMLVLCLVVASFVLYGSHLANGYWLDGQGYILGRDFLNTWHYGLAAWNGEAMTYYSVWDYNAVLDRLIPGHDYPDQNWSYPPHYMLLAAPLGLMGYNCALAVFTLIGLFGWWKVVVQPFAETENRVALFTMPTLTVYLLCGQVSALITVALVVIYRSLDNRPILAGLILALLTVKPQIGLLFPLFLILTGRWRVFLVAAVGTVALIGASLLIHGVEPWRYYLVDGISVQSSTLIGSNFVVTGLMPTIFVNAVMAGVPKTAAMAAHGMVALGAMAAMVWTLLKCRDPFLQFASLVAATLIITPYLMSYDTLVLGWVMLMLAGRSEMTAMQGIVYRFAMVVSPLGVLLAMSSIPGAPFAIVGVMAWVTQAAMQQVSDIDSVPQPAQ
ncbi:MAG: glycosyltransferase family 87 protein [Nitratireductor sp.]